MSTILHKLYWLPTRRCIQFKIVTLVYISMTWHLPLLIWTDLDVRSHVIYMVTEQCPVLCNKQHEYTRKIISGLEIKKSPILHKCILFGFPNSNSEQKEKIHILNFCVLYTKYYIYSQRLLKHNSLDVYACLVQIKAALNPTLPRLM